MQLGQRKGQKPAIPLAICMQRCHIANARRKLRVGAAVGTRIEDRERCQRMHQAGLDVLILDSSQGETGWTRVKGWTTEEQHIRRTLGKNQEILVLIPDQSFCVPCCGTPVAASAFLPSLFGSRQCSTQHSFLCRQASAFPGGCAESDWESAWQHGVWLLAGLCIWGRVCAGDSTYQVEMLKWIKASCPGMDVICGNIVTGRQVGFQSKAHHNSKVDPGACRSRACLPEWVPLSLLLVFRHARERLLL